MHAQLVDPTTDFLERQARAYASRQMMPTPLTRRVRRRVHHQLVVAVRLLRRKRLSNVQYAALAVAAGCEWHAVKQNQELSLRDMTINWANVVGELTDCLFAAPWPADLAEAEHKFGPYSKAPYVLAKSMHPEMGAMQLGHITTVSLMRWDDEADEWLAEARDAVSWHGQHLAPIERGVAKWKAKYPLLFGAILWFAATIGTGVLGAIGGYIAGARHAVTAQTQTTITNVGPTKK